MESNLRYIILYPIYIDKKARLKHGRRVPKKYAVESPNIIEFRDILNSFGYKTTVEMNKYHPRDVDKDNPSGRIKVELTSQQDEDNNKSKKELIRLLCENIPKLKTRVFNEANKTTKTKKGKR
ncbi:hypothetical protein HZS_391 [Henneguya salminicola]|nr:hypothetical protein HZS_391 [Henneguya salminicola]